MDLKQRIEDLNAMVLKGQILEAMEEFYADDIVMQENDGPETRGKDANKAREQDWLKKLVTVNGFEVKGVAVGDGVTMVEWFMDYQHQEWGHVKHHQVAVQRWKDGRIVHERFYYGA